MLVGTICVLVQVWEVHQDVHRLSKSAAEQRIALLLINFFFQKQKTFGFSRKVLKKEYLRSFKVYFMETTIEEEVAALQNDLKLLEEEKAKYQKYCEYVVRLEKQLSTRTKRIHKTIEKLKERNINR